MKPHIILITADQMRADNLGCAGTPVLTPHLDRLAARGTMFDRAFCVNPVCTPSRAAIFTGRYPHCTGAWNIGVSLNEDEMTLADHLRPLGYRSVAVGKMHFRPECKPTRPEGGWPGVEDPAIAFRGRQRDGTYYGFDETHITEDVRHGEYLDWLKQVAPEWVDYHGDSPEITRDGSPLPPELHQTRWIGQKSIEAIQNHDPAQPLFLWTSFVDPHHPFNAPKKYVDLYRDVPMPVPIERAGEHDLRPAHLRRQGDRGYWPGGGEEHRHTAEEISAIIRNSYAMITFIDEEIGRLLDALAGKGMLDNAIIVFTTDHGDWLGDHHLLTKGPWLYDSLTRVPMIFAGPGIPGGARTPALMENVDILPTLLELIGQPIPYGVQGRSCGALFRGEKQSIRDSALTSYDIHDRGIRLKSLRTDAYKLNVFAGEEYGELFDLQRDPDELRNVYFDEAYRPIRDQLHRQLLFRLMQDEDPLPERRCQW